MFLSKNMFKHIWWSDSDDSDDCDLMPIHDAALRKLIVYWQQKGFGHNSKRVRSDIAAYKIQRVSYRIAPKNFYIK